MLSGPHDLNVSRETMEALEYYVEELVKWNTSINLISKSTVSTIWKRHILDSAQVFFRAPEAGKWIDFGSGGGLPAIVCAILARGESRAYSFRLIESDQRKSVFLAKIIRDLGLDATVICKRIEQVTEGSAAVISARALAILSRLLPLVQRFSDEKTAVLLLKGKSWQKEVHQAEKDWYFELKAYPSQICSDAVLLELRNIRRLARQ